MRRALLVQGAVLGILALVALVVCLARPVLANGLPVRFLRDPASILAPHEATPVGVVREVLTFDFREATLNGHQWYPEVVASYHLRNPSGETQRVTVAFLYLDRWAGDGPPVVEGLAGMFLSWQGEPLTVSLVSPPPQVGADLWTREFHWLDPATGRRYDVRPVRQGAPIRAAVAAFDVDARGEGVLEVRYRQEDSGCDQCNRWIGEPIWHYTYLLQPARHWAFFETLTVRVIVPPGMALAAEPSLRPQGGGVWEASFDGLPEGDLHLSIRPPGHTAEVAAAWGTALVVAVGPVAWVLIRRRRGETRALP